MAVTASKPSALVVEDDAIQRMALVDLLEAVNVQVIECDSAEAALAVLDDMGGAFCLMMTDINLAGAITGADLAVHAHQRFPRIRVIVTSARAPPPLPEGTLFLPKPWDSAVVLNEAKTVCR